MLLTTIDQISKRQKKIQTTNHAILNATFRNEAPSIVIFNSRNKMAGIWPHSSVVALMATSDLENYNGTDHVTAAVLKTEP